MNAEVVGDAGLDIGEVLGRDKDKLPVFHLLRSCIRTQQVQRGLAAHGVPV